MTLALQSVFYSLQTQNEVRFSACASLNDHTCVQEVSTQDLTRAFGWASYEAFLQQDVQEMMRVLLDKLESKMKNTPVDRVIQET
jgi:ubiquitin carboxyl-terminal hydrolase 7